MIMFVLTNREKWVKRVKSVAENLSSTEIPHPQQFLLIISLFISSNIMNIRKLI